MAQEQIGEIARKLDRHIEDTRTNNKNQNENWMDTEYNNQNDEAAFWGTWTDVSTFTPQAMWFM